MFCCETELWESRTYGWSLGRRVKGHSAHSTPLRCINSACTLLRHMCTAHAPHHPNHTCTAHALRMWYMHMLCTYHTCTTCATHTPPAAQKEKATRHYAGQGAHWICGRDSQTQDEEGVQWPALAGFHHPVVMIP